MHHDAPTQDIHDASNCSDFGWMSELDILDACLNQRESIEIKPRHFQ